MRSKAPLALMEQIVMLLVFSLAAAVCVRAFVLADRVSRDNAARDQAALKAETAAEVYKACRGDGALAVEKLGGSVERGAWVTLWDADGEQAREEKNAAYRVRVEPEQGGGLLGRAAVTVSAKDGGTLFEMEIAWQEADGVA